MVETFNQLLAMSDEERKLFIKKMASDDRLALMDMMGLAKTCSQKRLCQELEETARFIRIASPKGKSC